MLWHTKKARLKSLLLRQVPATKRLVHPGETRCRALYRRYVPGTKSFPNTRGLIVEGDSWSDWCQRQNHMQYTPRVQEAGRCSWSTCQRKSDRTVKTQGNVTGICPWFMPQAAWPYSQFQFKLVRLMCNTAGNLWSILQKILVKCVLKYVKYVCKVLLYITDLHFRQQTYQYSAVLLAPPNMKRLAPPLVSSCTITDLYYNVRRIRIRLIFPFIKKYSYFNHTHPT